MLAPGKGARFSLKHRKANQNQIPYATLSTFFILHSSFCLLTTPHSSSRIDNRMGIRVTLIQGGGTGYDQVPAVLRIIDAAGVSIEWDLHLAGLASLEKGGVALPKAMLDSVRSTGLALKTKLFSPPGPPSGNSNVQFRKELGLFASVRPLKNINGLPARFQGVDLLVIREITEDLYTAIEHEIVPGVVQSIKVVTQTACRRFFRFACEWSRAAGRKTVHCVHKANILKLADGLFLETFREVAREF